MIVLPRRRPGRQSAAAVARYEAELDAFCEAVLQIHSGLDITPSSRGWAYILEEHGITKGDFDLVQKVIAECRKAGRLPADLVTGDAKRETRNLEMIDDDDPGAEAEWIVNSIEYKHHHFTPFSFWDDQEHYVEMLVEKTDLVQLFEPVCREFNIPIANAGGWSDVTSRIAIKKRFAEWHAAGKQCVLLYCGDHDPGGYEISRFLHENLEEVEAVNFWSDDLVIDRFGLNYDFITEHGLTWIDNLETGSGRRLDDPRHPDHRKPYVQEYLARYGARKVEANALVVRPEAGRRLCRQAILKYLDAEAPARYRAKLEPIREHVGQLVLERLQVRFGGEA